MVATLLPHRFFEQYPGFIGYWIAPFAAIVITEHFIFRNGMWSHYDPEHAWNKPRHPNLARGYAALATFVACIGLIAICMSQPEWTGPVARRGTGDIALLVSFGFGILAFLVTRWIERRLYS